MKLSNRLLRLGVALAIAGIVSAQIPLRGGSGVALAQNEYPTGDNGNIFQKITQAGGIALLAYGVFNTNKGGTPQTGGGGAGAGRPLYDITAAQGEDFSELKRLIDQADLRDTLRNDGPFTFFAPTNAALGQMPPEDVASLVSPANRTRLQNVIKYHVVVGRYTIADLKKMGDGTPLQTLTGDGIVVTNTGGLKVNGVPVVEDDIPAANGWLHPLQGRLSPPEGSEEDPEDPAR